MSDAIKRCLIVDTETTGLDPVKDRVIEVGAVLYSVEHHTTICQFSALIASSREGNAAEAINRIPPAALASLSELDDAEAPLKTTFAMLRSWADVIVAHNAEFDQQWFKGAWLEKPWACSKYDFAWPHGSAGDSLVYLALAHGIGVLSAHRALTDCQLIAALFDRMPLYGRDLGEMFAHAMRPAAIFQAIVPFEEKDLAKEAGFKWDGGTKRWTRRMAIEDAAALPFRTQRLGEVS